MNKKRVLFFCIHNSARSQIAEAWLKKIGGGAFEVESAGLEPRTLKPIVVEAMKEAGIDIAGKQTQSIFNLFKSGRVFDSVIALCDEGNAMRCPAFPAPATFLRWSFPERPKGTHLEKEQLAHFRDVRDSIKSQVETWLAENP